MLLTRSSVSCGYLESVLHRSSGERANGWWTRGFEMAVQMEIRCNLEFVKPMSDHSVLRDCVLV